MRLIVGVMCAVLAVGLAGCSASDRNPTGASAEPPPIGVNTSSRWPDDDPLAWAMVSDHLVVVTATEEQELPPDDELKLREVTFTVEEVLWSRPDAVELPRTLTWSEYGWARHGDDGEWSEMQPNGAPRVEEGQRYLVSVVWAPAVEAIPEGWGPLSSQSTIALVDDTDRLDKTAMVSGSWAYELETTDEVAAELKEVTPKAQKALANSKVPNAAADPDKRGRAWRGWWRAHGLKG